MRLAVLLLLINLNTATPAELRSLPGIGPTLAKRIIELQEKRHGFKRVENCSPFRVSARRSGKRFATRSK
jgi:predicted DNA-binding helix-hairpin-helix protein